MNTWIHGEVGTGKTLVARGLKRELEVLGADRGVSVGIVELDNIRKSCKLTGINEDNMLEEILDEPSIDHFIFVSSSSTPPNNQTIGREIHLTHS